MDKGEKTIITFFTAMQVEDISELSAELAELFILVNQDGSGEINSQEMVGAINAIKELPAGEFDNLKKLDFDRTMGSDVPREGNPFMFMIWVMNLMAEVAGSSHEFDHELLDKIEAEEAAKEAEKAALERSKFNGKKQLATFLRGLLRCFLFDACASGACL